MTQIQFYHLTATPLERALPKLVEKAWQAGHRVLLVEGAPERLEMFNQGLWTFSPNAFLPHGSERDPDPELHPVLLVTKEHNANNADLFLTTDGTLPASQDYARVIDLFDGNDKEAVERARSRWAHYKNAGFSPSYLRQTESGGWEEKQAA